MVRATACRSVLITVCLLFVCTALSSAQSDTRRQQEPRGLPAVPATPTAPAPERRIALVIGNAAYQYTTPLANPVNDAQDIARVLTTVQFQVILKTDATLETMADAIFAFGERLKGGGVELFYYAGHGMQVKGENYLIPVDAHVGREDDIKRKTINARDILDKMDEAKSHLNLVFLDACRNNPFPRSVRAVSRGLAGMNAPSGTLLVFATNPDNVAADGTSRNGAYTKHLLHYITQPGLEVGMMLRQIRTAVKAETGGQQVPWENGSIEGEFYFNGRSEGPPVTPPSVQAQPTLPGPQPASHTSRCFDAHPGAGTTDRTAHTTYATGKPVAVLAQDLERKVDVVTGCNGFSNENLVSLFVGASVLIAQAAPTCFPHDPGANLVDPNAHQSFAMRLMSAGQQEQLIANLKDKMHEALACIGPQKAHNLFADLSVMFAGAAP